MHRGNCNANPGRSRHSSLSNVHTFLEIDHNRSAFPCQRVLAQIIIRSKTIFPCGLNDDFVWEYSRQLSLFLHNAP